MTGQQIEELIQKYANGMADEEETRTLIDWYRHAFNETEWLSTDPKEKEKVHDRMLRRLQAETDIPNGRVISFPWLKVAAIFILFLSVAAWLVFFQPVSPTYLTVTNPSQKVQLIRLPDNSEVWLNANSTLRYTKKFPGDRDLHLTGEAHFKVTHDPAHPFVVNAGHIRTTVLGTSFTVKAYSSAAAIAVTVTSGRVKVDHDKKELAVLTPTQQLRYNTKDNEFSLASIDTINVTSWTRGRLQFEGQSFSEIAATLENWYGTRIILSDPGFGNCRYYMNFENTISIENILSALSAMTGMKYTIDKEKNTVNISGKACQ